MTTDTFTYACQECGATINVEQGNGQPHDCGGLMIELTEALIRRDKTILVRLEREWPGDDRWRISPDRALSAGAYMDAQSVDGWVQATNTAAKMAHDVLAHETAQEQAHLALQSQWPRYSGGPASPGASEIEFNRRLDEYEPKVKPQTLDQMFDSIERNAGHE